MIIFYRKLGCLALIGEPGIRPGSQLSLRFFQHGDIEIYLKGFARKGMSITRQVDGRTEWDEVCVVGSGIGIMDYQCPWLEYDEENNLVSIPDGDRILYGPTRQFLVNKPDVIEISGKLQGVNGIYAGSVSLDKFRIGHNCDGSGRYFICLPNTAVTNLNRETHTHQITFRNFVTGKDSVRDFHLDGTSLYDLNE